MGGSLYKTSGREGTYASRQTNKTKTKNKKKRRKKEKQDEANATLGARVYIFISNNRYCLHIRKKFSGDAVLSEMISGNGRQYRNYCDPRERRREESASDLYRNANITLMDLDLNIATGAISSRGLIVIENAYSRNVRSSGKEQCQICTTARVY